MGNTSESNKKIVTRFFEALNSGDVDFIVDTYAADGYVQTMGNTLISGIFSREQVAASAGGIFDVFPDGLTFTALSMVAEGEKVAVEAASEGQHISGQTYSNEYHFLFEFRSGKLVRLKEYMDTERVTDVLCGGQRPPTDI
ncbi:MAG: nuclear transport factor 2 family protein [Halioglobus sp.]|nr:nuclear transport factor 2 family protein [Halioglobus sp.]